jgi:hypothetical protein
MCHHRRNSCAAPHRFDRRAVRALGGCGMIVAMAIPYDPDREPSLPFVAQGEAEQLASVLDYHATHDPSLNLSQRRVHSALHVVVERQLTVDKLDVTRETLDRLVGAGLTRHDALHAIADGAIEEIMAILRKERTFDPRLYSARLRAIDPRPWLRGNKPAP